MNEGIHFNLVYFPLKHLGYKAAIKAFSNIYAMNGTPRQLMVSLSVSAKFSLKALETIYEGIKFACQLYQVDFTGGDTNSSITGMSITTTAIGEADAKNIVHRGGAKEGDLICVSGDLGAAYMGLQLLEREKKVFQDQPGQQPELKGKEYILERQLKPEARKDTVAHLQKEGIHPTAMIDVADGLASDIIQICKSAEKGCRIIYNDIPLHQETREMAEEMSFDPVLAALHGGDDFELLFTVDPGYEEQINSATSLYHIGEIRPAGEGYQLISPDKQVIGLKAQGWPE